MITVITRTLNRKNLYRRCHDSVLRQPVKCNHVVICEDENDLSYINESETENIHIVDRQSIEESYTDPAPESAVPKIKAIHNLFFNDIYHTVSDPWVYHLDDDNYLVDDAFTGIIPHLTDDIDLAIVRINHFLGVLPTVTDCKTRNVRLCGIDTGCIIARTSLMKTVLWDGWKCSDYRVIKKCCELSQKTIWVNKIVMNMEKSGGSDRAV
tara:strand:+ start:582 stop:1211 length:630 start_codon:yes stop_codon:yes gene_type:complete